MSGLFSSLLGDLLEPKSIKKASEERSEGDCRVPRRKSAPWTPFCPIGTFVFTFWFGCHFASEGIL